MPTDFTGSKQSELARATPLGMSVVIVPQTAAPSSSNTADAVPVTVIFQSYQVSAATVTPLLLMVRELELAQTHCHSADAAGSYLT